MAHWVNKVQWETDNGRYRGKSQTGVSSDHVKPTTYSGYGGHGSPHSPVGTSPPYDIPNLAFTAAVLGGSSNFPFARNKAWSKMADAARKGPVMLAVDLAEWRQSLDMIGGRCLQMYHAYKALRRGNFREFAKTLGVSPLRKDRNRLKSLAGQASNHWLEYSFGWKPLFQDIYGAMDILSRPLPSGKVSGSGSETLNRLLNVGVSQSEWFSAIVHVKQGCTVTVDDPNAFLLQELGIANPASIAWELIPFSFVVDWVFDVGSFLGSFTDLLGLSVSNGYTTTFSKANIHVTWNPSHNTRSGMVYVCRRLNSLTTPIPNTRILANIGTSLQRAANAASLLGQLLANKH